MGKPFRKRDFSDLSDQLVEFFQREAREDADFKVTRFLGNPVVEACRILDEIEELERTSDLRRARLANLFAMQKRYDVAG